MNTKINIDWKSLIEEAAAGKDELYWEALRVWHKSLNDADSVDDTMASHLVSVALEAVRKAFDITEELQKTAMQIERDMQNLQASITKGYAVNSFGELQSRGTKLDMLCARREDAFRNANAICHVLSES